MRLYLLVRLTWPAAPLFSLQAHEALAGYTPNCCGKSAVSNSETSAIAKRVVGRAVATAKTTVESGRHRAAAVADHVIQRNSILRAMRPVRAASSL